MLVVCPGGQTHLHWECQRDADASWDLFLWLVVDQMAIRQIQHPRELSCPLACAWVCTRQVKWNRWASVDRQLDEAVKCFFQQELRWTLQFVACIGLLLRPHLLAVPSSAGAWLGEMLWAGS